MKTPSQEDSKCCDLCKCPPDCDQPGFHCRSTIRGIPQCKCHSTPPRTEEKWEPAFAELWNKEAGVYDSKLMEPFLNYITNLLSTQKAKDRAGVREMVEEKIHIAKTRVRMTPFQDTLFNYEVNVLSGLLDNMK